MKVGPKVIKNFVDNLPLACPRCKAWVQESTPLVCLVVIGQESLVSDGFFGFGTKDLNLSARKLVQVLTNFDRSRSLTKFLELRHEHDVLWPKTDPRMNR